MPTSLRDTKLFMPLKLGNLNLKHRVIMAPLTRVRCPEHIPSENVVEYYRQRASNGGLIVSEATHISVMGGNYCGAPGIFTLEQRRAWRKVTDAVHEKGGYIICQLWHVGRTTHPLNTGGRKPLGPSPNTVPRGKVAFTPQGMQDYVQAQEMTLQDIQETTEDYVYAAKNAIAAGFDGVQVHGANGYAIDQFLCDNINQRTDKYGGSTENRARFAIEIVDAVTAAVGPERTSIRFSPFSYFQGTETSDIIGQYGYAMQQLDSRGLAFVELIEPRSDFITSDGPSAAKLERLKKYAKSRGFPDNKLDEVVSLKPFRDMLKKTPLLSNGAFNQANSVAPLENGDIDGIVYGRYFISNPDLPERLRNGWPLNPYNSATFYSDGKEGYLDYPTYIPDREAREML